MIFEIKLINENGSIDIRLKRSVDADEVIAISSACIAMLNPREEEIEEEVIVNNNSNTNSNNFINNNNVQIDVNGDKKFRLKIVHADDKPKVVEILRQEGIASLPEAREIINGRALSPVIDKNKMERVLTRLQNVGCFAAPKPVDEDDEETSELASILQRLDEEEKTSKTA